MATLLELKDICLDPPLPGQGEPRLLDQVSFSVEEDDFVAVIGPAGSGKSPLVRIAAGILAPDSGGLFYRGDPMLALRREIGVVLQTPALFPWMSVQENIAIGLEKLALGESKRQETVAWAVGRVGLGGYEEAYPRELSLGMKMRVALARALAGQPELLILDAPFSGLDVLTAESLRAEILALWQNADVNPKAILMVTHNILEAVEMANRVLIFSGTPTRLKVEVPNPLSYPRDSSSADFADKVAQVHDLITRDVMPDEAPVPGRFQMRLAPLPRAEIGEMVGLLESLADQGGRFDVFDFISETRKEYSSVLMVVNIAEMLELVRTPREQVELTELGRKFLNSEINERKIILNLQLQKLKLVRHFMEMLSRAPEHWLAREIVMEQLAMLLPSEQPTRQFTTLVGWARYAELFGYSVRRGQLYLDRILSLSLDGQIQESKSPRPPARSRRAETDNGDAPHPAEEIPR